MGSKRDLDGFKTLEPRHALPLAYLSEALARLGTISRPDVSLAETSTESGRQRPGYSLRHIDGKTYSRPG
jgi:hypothetical protein